MLNSQDFSARTHLKTILQHGSCIAQYTFYIRILK